MSLGLINLFCPICGQVFRLGIPRSDAHHAKEFGWLCSKACYEQAEKKYAAMILGHDEP